MSNFQGDTLGCRLKLLGIKDWNLDEKSNLTYVGGISSPIVIIPYGVHGLIGTGFSGLDLEVLKFNKDLVRFELMSLANCNKLRELYVYKHQLPLISGLEVMYSDLQIIVRKDMV